MRIAETLRHLLCVVLAYIGICESQEKLLSEKAKFLVPHQPEVEISTSLIANATEVSKVHVQVSKSLEAGTSVATTSQQMRKAMEDGVRTHVVRQRIKLDNPYPTIIANENTHRLRAKTDDNMGYWESLAKEAMHTQKTVMRNIGGTRDELQLLDQGQKQTGKSVITAGEALEKNVFASKEVVLDDTQKIIEDVENQMTTLSALSKESAGSSKESAGSSKVENQMTTFSALSKESAESSKDSAGSSKERAGSILAETGTNLLDVKSATNKACQEFIDQKLTARDNLQPEDEAISPEGQASSQFTKSIMCAGQDVKLSVKQGHHLSTFAQHPDTQNNNGVIVVDVKSVEDAGCMWQTVSRSECCGGSAKILKDEQDQVVLSCTGGASGAPCWTRKRGVGGVIRGITGGNRDWDLGSMCQSGTKCTVFTGKDYGVCGTNAGENGS